MPRLVIVLHMNSHHLKGLIYHANGKRSCCISHFKFWICCWNNVWGFRDSCEL